MTDLLERVGPPEVVVRTKMVPLRPVVLLFATISLFGCGEAELWRRTDELRIAVEEQVPLGSSPEQVEAFLREQGIEDYSTGGSRGGDSTIHRQHPELAEKTRYVTQATIRDVYRGFLISSSIYPSFYYDADKKLIWSTVKVISDGL